MKHIFNIFLILSFTFFATSCGNDDYDEKPLSEVKVVEEFEPAGGTSKVTLDGIAGATITSNMDWCVASLSGNTITIDVVTNNTFEGRTAKISIKTANQLMFISVYQSGNNFWIDGLDLRKETLSFHPEGESTGKMKVLSNLPLQISIDGDWIKYTYENSVLTIWADATTKSRYGTLKLKSGDREVVYAVNQICYNAYEDFLGEWNISFTETSSAGTFEIEDKATLTQLVAGKSFRISSPEFMAPFTVLYNESKSSLVIEAGQYLGTASGYNVVIGLITESGYIDFDDELQLEAKPDIDDNGTCVFADNGSWPGEVINRLQYSAINPTTGAYGGGFYTLSNIKLTK